MSADFAARAVLGARVDVSRFVRRVRTSDHKFPDDWDFHPVSGKPLWRTESGRAVLASTKFGHGIRAFEDGHGTGSFVVGIDLCRLRAKDGPAAAMMRLPPAEVAMLYDTAKQGLREASLTFDEQDFGIHVVIETTA